MTVGRRIEHERLIPTSPRLVLIQRTLAALVALRRVIEVDAAIAASTYLVVLQVRSGRARRIVDARSAIAFLGGRFVADPPGGDSSGSGRAGSKSDPARSPFQSLTSASGLRGGFVR